MEYYIAAVVVTLAILALVEWAIQRALNNEDPRSVYEFMDYLTKTGRDHTQVRRWGWPC